MNSYSCIIAFQLVLYILPLDSFVLSTKCSTGLLKSGILASSTINGIERKEVLDAKLEAPNGGWFPVGAVGYLDESLPTEIVIANEKLVVWKNPLDDKNELTKGWSVMKDYCPHRLAPLSQGRIDPITGCIECPYHGWQFNGTGACTSIPHLELDITNRVLGSSKTSASSLLVYVTGDIIWAFVPLPEGQASSFPTLPDEIFPCVQSPVSFFVQRELPYSFEFLVENFMDVSHIPYAHHSLQSVRSDGVPMPMKMLTDIFGNKSFEKVEATFKDLVKGKEREGIVSFIPPCYYHFRVKDPKTNDYNIALLIFCMPTSPGRSRAILTAYPRSPPPSTETESTSAKPAKPTRNPLLSRFPKFIIHARVNKFLESDLWLHDQELLLRGKSISNNNVGEEINTQESNNGIQLQEIELLNESSSENNNNLSVDSHVSTTSTSISSSTSDDNPIRLQVKNQLRRLPSLETSKNNNLNYILPAVADTGTIAWMKWYRKHMSKSSIFGPSKNFQPLPVEKQLDRYETHAKYCKPCRTALEKAQKIKQLAPFISLFIIAISKNIFFRLFGVVVYFVLDKFSSKAIRAVNGLSRGEKYSVAQYAK
eukprot:gene8445-11423_t